MKIYYDPLLCIMAKYRYCLILIHLLFLISCSDKKINVDIPVYALNEAYSRDVDSLFKGVEAVPLLFEGDTYPGTVENFLVIPGYVIVNGKHKIIHIFKDDGHYLSCSEDKIGGGPGEYSIMMGYTWNPYNNLIEIITPNAFLSYDFEFNMVKSSSIPTKIGNGGLMFGQIFDIAENKHLLLPTSASKNPFRILLYDSERREFIRELDYKKDIVADISMQNNSFFRTSDYNLLFCPPAITKCVYDIPENFSSLNKLFSIELGNNGITKEEFEKYDDHAARSKYYINSNKIMPLRVLPNSAIILVLLKDGKTMRDFSIVRIDRATGDMISVKLYEKGEYKIPIIGYIDEEYAYSIVEKEFIKDNPALLMGCYSSDWINNVEDESLVLLKYKF